MHAYFNLILQVSLAITIKVIIIKYIYSQDFIIKMSIMIQLYFGLYS